MPMLFGAIWILLVSLFCMSSFFCFSHEITIVAITHNDHSYLSEWIEYHKLIGVSHFYIYDNNNSDETKNALNEYIESGTVEYIKWPNLWPNKHFSSPRGCQSRAYKDAQKS